MIDVRLNEVQMRRNSDFLLPTLSVVVGRSLPNAGIEEQLIKKYGSFTLLFERRCVLVFF